MWHPTHDSHAFGDEGLAEAALAQDGAVSLAQLRALGFGRGAVAHRVARGRLHRLYPAVFAVGHLRLTPRGRAIAAVLAAGPGAVLSHRSAAAQWGLRPTARSRHELITPTHRRTPGLELHRCRLGDDAVTESDGIPITTVAQTIVDLADVVPPNETRKAVVRGDQLRILDFAALTGAVERGFGRRGQGVLSAILADDQVEAAMTRSELEDRMFALLRAAHLALPHVNCPVETPGQTYVPDFLWPDHRLSRRALHLASGARRATKGRRDDP